jgi:hypothetical protein
LSQRSHALAPPHSPRPLRNHFILLGASIWAGFRDLGEVPPPIPGPPGPEENPDPPRGHLGCCEELGFRFALTYISDMLRMRKPWSELDLSDLRELLQKGRSVAAIAEFLCRDVDEIEAKIADTASCHA